MSRSSRYGHWSDGLIFFVTVSLFLVLGYSEEYWWQIKYAPFKTLFPLAARDAIIPTAVMFITYYSTSYLSRRVLAWSIYAISFVLVVLIAYPNFSKLPLTYFYLRQRF